MVRLDFFSGASERWKTDAKIRARRVIAEHADDPIGYVQRRIELSRFGTFERRRWNYIRKLVTRDVERERVKPLASA